MPQIVSREAQAAAGKTPPSAQVTSTGGASGAAQLVQAIIIRENVRRFDRSSPRLAVSTNEFGFAGERKTAADVEALEGVGNSQSYPSPVGNLFSTGRHLSMPFLASKNWKVPKTISRDFE